MKRVLFFMTKIMIIILVTIIIIIIVKGHVFIDNRIQRGRDANRSNENVSGHFSLIKKAPERIEYLMSPSGRYAREEAFWENEYRYFCEHNDNYRAFEIELFSRTTPMLNLVN